MNEKLMELMEKAPRSLKMAKNAATKVYSRTVPTVTYVWGKFDPATLETAVIQVDVVPMGYKSAEKDARAKELGAFCMLDVETEQQYFLTIQDFVTVGYQSKDAALKGSRDVEMEMAEEGGDEK